MPLSVVRPGSVKAAVAALAADNGARFLGGGTLLVRAQNSGDLSIRTLVLSDGLGLDEISIKGGRIEIGAAVTMAVILAAPKLSFLHDVAREIGGPAVRAMATVGGNLFARSPYGDFAAALLALDAEVAVRDPTKSEKVALEAFLKNRGRKGRVVKSVAFATPPAGAFRFAKVMRRHPHGASVLSIAALLPIVRGKVKGARVAYGAMAATPIRAKAVEKALEGNALDAATIERAVAVAAEGTAPPTDPFASAWYRSNVLPVHLARLLKR
jgi:CO/xanthine dehydrogenase FAD-binding subunit